MFEAITITESAVEGEQSEEETLNSWTHTPFAHEVAGIATEPHSSPEVELV